LAIVALLLPVVVRADEAGVAKAAPAVRVLKDLPYKAGEGLDEYERARCKLDLYLPDAKGFATVVWFYGGGMEGGEKGGRGNVAIAQTLARSGVACAVVNYRLSPKAKYPAYLDDAAAGVAWALGHVTEHGGDAKRVFVSGHSAGAYLAAQVGFDPKFLKKYGVTSDRLAGIVPVSPQVFTHFTIRKERGVPNPQTTPVIDDDAPAYHARADGPATLILIGDDDWPARLEECQYFVKLLKVMKHPDASLRVIAGRTHNSIAEKAGAEAGDPAMGAVLEFVGRRVAKVAE
jgi:alpha-beta hydrolase superfamily lysophospholipase